MYRCMCRVNQYPNTYFTIFPNEAYTFNEYDLDLMGLANLDTHAADMKEYADPNQIISQAKMYTCTNSEPINT